MKKKLIIMIVALSMLLILVSCGGKSTQKELTVGELQKIVEEKIDLSTFRKDNAQGLEYLYGIKEGDVAEFVYYSPAKNIHANEILILKAKSKEDVSTLEDKVKMRIETLSKNFETYIPAEYELVQKRLYKVDGDLIILVIAKDVDKLSESF